MTTPRSPRRRSSFLRTVLPVALWVASATGCAGEEEPFQVTYGDAVESHGHEGHDEPEPPTATPAASLAGVEMSLGAGVGGSVWVLATYGNGGTHPGANAIDLGAPAGTTVWHQIAGIPAHVAGGWLYVQHVQSPGYCSQYNPGDEYYNGAKLRVWTLFYDEAGDMIGYHWAAYQHVEPEAGVPGGWFRWNNANANQGLWAEPEVALANGAEGGLSVGTLFAGEGRRITNGPNGGLCHQGDHLHQESVGWRDSSLSLYGPVAERTTSTHWLIAYDGVPSVEPPYQPGPAAGGTAPPSEPPAEPPPGEEPPPAEEPPPPPAPATCACVASVDNFCHLTPNTDGCAMTQPGGYCDPNGDGSYADADWVQGWHDYHDQCM